MEIEALDSLIFAPQRAENSKAIREFHRKFHILEIRIIKPRSYARADT